MYTRKSSDEALEQDFNSLDAQNKTYGAHIASQRFEGWVFSSAVPHKTKPKARLGADPCRLSFQSSDATSSMRKSLKHTRDPSLGETSPLDANYSCSVG